jgi:hypothetical protein
MEVSSVIINSFINQLKSRCTLSDAEDAIARLHWQPFRKRARVAKISCRKFFVDCFKTVTQTISVKVCKRKTDFNLPHP